MIRLFRSKIYIAIALMLTVLLAGTLGYHFISELSWLNAIYMTIITVTTVGFNEVGPLETEGKIFTIFLIISSVFIFA
ncbi:MAG: potassium channel family protein, partial [Eudoraea sp.]